MGTAEIIGTWIGAIMTLAIFSFLYKDNPLYKIAEQIFVGLSAGYWFVYTFYNIIKPNLYTPLSEDFSTNYMLLIPAILGILMLTRVFGKIGWLSRFPMALMIGSSAGLGFITYLKTDILEQLRATMINPLSVSSGAQFAGWVTIIGQFLLVGGTICGIAYFYFSKKHEGAFGFTAKIGIYFLMVSFGAAFGYTAMARISLLIGRLQFLLGDWLHLIK